MRRPARAVLLAAIIAVSFFAGNWFKRPPASVAAAPGVLHYVCPMHPEYTSPRPGNAPCCGMRMEPVYAGAEGGPAAPPGPPGTVRIDPENQQTVGVRTAEVEKRAGMQRVRLAGRIAADERRIYRVNAAVTGWIRETFENSTGSLVDRDELLATFYSPEFLSAEQALIYALNSLDRFQSTGRETAQQIALTQANIQQAADTLRNLGMGELQLEQLRQTRKLTQKIEIRSPAKGFIVLRNISPGLRFDKGTELYRIADLDRIWIVADVFENDAPCIRAGMNATVRYHGRTFSARMSNVLPQFDPSTRILKVRLERDNPGYVLRPDMFVDVELEARHPAVVTVPADAVIDSGLKKIVYVAVGDRHFEPRQIETATRYGGNIAVTRGLEPGERIVVSGNFLIDSESRMELAATSAGSTAKKTALEKDPVCGMQVDAKAPDAIRAEYRGRTYYFCSKHCKSSFQADPEKYVVKESLARDANEEQGPA